MTLRRHTFPQLTIWDSLFLHNISFKLFMNSTCGVHGNPQCHSVDPNTPYAGSPLRPTAMPDVAMSGVGRHKRHFASQEQFYSDSATGRLPGVSWLMPPTEASDHPCFDVAKGERFLKDVYEAVRAGPGWNNSLVLAVYDDAGCYYDQVSLCL